MTGPEGNSDICFPGNIEIRFVKAETRCDKSLRHIVATSLLVCTAATTSHCDKTLVRCTQLILKERKCKLVQI